MINALGSVYAAAASRRRAWYAAHPERQRRLVRPVISVGNLRAGGSGKTPLVEHIARLLLARGERPAVLTRGYGRRLAPAGATVVSDGTAVLADVDHAGDEPLMLAQSVNGLIVVVGADRYLSGCLAEIRLGATIHILDDGFQHFELARSVDLIAVADDDLRDRPIPAGRLREPLSAAARADAALVDAPDMTSAAGVGRALGVPRVFRVARRIGEPRSIAGGHSVVRPDTPAFAMAGIARPDRFFGDLAAAGWQLKGTRSFRDHHRFAARDVTNIVASARAAGAAAVVTTEKDAVRLGACVLPDFPFAAVPLTAIVEPAPEFAAWLLERVA